MWVLDCRMSLESEDKMEHEINTGLKGFGNNLGLGLRVLDQL